MGTIGNTSRTGQATVGLFKRQTRAEAGGTRLEVAAIKLRGGSEQAVAGESHYQAALSKVCGGKNYDGHHHGCVAALVLEPDNEHDPYAVAVQIDAMKVGYLPREDALAYGPVLNRLAAQGHIGTCDAEIRGGWDRGRDDEGHFGVVLFLAPPNHCHPDDSPPSAPQRSGQARSRPHTGASSSPRLEAGMVRGRHYTDWVEAVKDLKRLGHNEQARNLLLELCAAAEKEGAATGSSIPPWYFEQAAIVYRKLKDVHGEVAVLERYLASPLAVESGLQERLAKARAKMTSTDQADPPTASDYSAGWYEDPWGDSTSLRYYDGTQWTGHVERR